MIACVKKVSSSIFAVFCLTFWHSLFDNEISDIRNMCALHQTCLLKFWEFGSAACNLSVSWPGCEDKTKQSEQPIPSLCWYWDRSDPEHRWWCSSQTWWDCFWLQVNGHKFSMSASPSQLYWAVTDISETVILLLYQLAQSIMEDRHFKSEQFTLQSKCWQETHILISIHMTYDNIVIHILPWLVQLVESTP